MTCHDSLVSLPWGFREADSETNPTCTSHIAQGPPIHGHCGRSRRKRLFAQRNLSAPTNPGGSCALAKPLSTADIGIQLLMDSTVSLQEIEARITARVFAALHNPERSPMVGAALHAARISEALPLRCEALPLRCADLNCCLSYRAPLPRPARSSCTARTCPTRGPDRPPARLFLGLLSSAPDTCSCADLSVSSKSQAREAIIFPSEEIFLSVQTERQLASMHFGQCALRLPQGLRA